MKGNVNVNQHEDQRRENVNVNLNVREKESVIVVTRELIHLIDLDIEKKNYQQFKTLINCRM